MPITEPIEVIFYSDSTGKEPFKKWLNSLNNSIVRRIDQRLLRLSIGNYGDYKFLAQGVYELRLAFGSGYRIYFGKDGYKIVVILSGGDKKTQKKDIQAAIEYWNKYKERKND